MKNALFLLMLLQGAAARANTNSNSSHMVVNIDKGELQVRFEKISEPYLIQSKATAGCKAELLVTQNNNTLTIKHDQQFCMNGRKMQLTLPVGKDISISMIGGVLDVMGSSSLKNNFNVIKADVLGGVLNSDVSDIEVYRTYGSGAVSYSSKHSKNTKLRIVLEGGVLSFKR